MSSVCSRFGFSTLLACAQIAPAFAADVSTSPETQAQIEQLQQQNQMLQQQMQAQRQLTEQLLKKIEGLEAKNVMQEEREQKREREEASEKATVAEQTTPEPLTPRVMQDLPKLTLKGFAEMDYVTRHQDSDSTNYFSLGSVDLFFLSEMNDQVSFLLETDFHYHASFPDVVHFHQERAELKYALSDLLNVHVGIMHTPLGYWNQTFHHGGWLQTPISRPEIYEFERPKEQHGFLPVHSVGIDVSGMLATDFADYTYDVGLLNGRGETRLNIQTFHDFNDSKAVNVLLGMAPHAIEGFRFGGDIYVDTIPPDITFDPFDPTSNIRTESMDEFILGGYAVYLRHPFEIFSEYFCIHHHDHETETSFNTIAWYLQTSYRFGKLTPYYRFEALNFGNDDPFFSVGNPAGDRYHHRIGLRWDVFTWNALKFEYTYTGNEGTGYPDSHEVILNTSFAF